MNPGYVFRILALCAVLCAAGQSAQAARFSGGYLLSMCASDKNGKEIVPGGHAVCQSYIAGVLDYHNIIHAMGTSPSVDFCIPEDVDMYTLQRRVFAYLMKNRDSHDKFVAAPAVALALYSAWPCKGASAKKK